MCDPLSIVTSVIGAGSSLLSASAQKKANNQNAALAQQKAAQDRQMIGDVQAQNTAWVDDYSGRTTDLLTGARDYQTGLYDSAQSGNQRLIDQNRAENQVTLDGNTAAITGLLTGIRDQNAGMVWQGLGANDADIRGYSDRAASSINAAKAENQALFQPFVSNGQSASNAINALLGLSGDATTQADAFKRWTDSTGFQFALDSGRRSVESSQAAEGMLESGATLKALQDRGQQTSQQYFGNYLAALQGQSGQGLSAAGSLGASNTSAAGQLSDLYQNTSGQLTGNRNFATNALVGINDSFADRQAANIGAYMSGTMGISDGYLANTTGNTNTYTGARAKAYDDWAGGVAGVNTAGLNAKVSGANAAMSGLMSSGEGLNSSLSQINSLNGQINSGLFSSLGKLGTGLASAALAPRSTTPAPTLPAMNLGQPSNIFQGASAMRLPYIY